MKLSRLVAPVLLVLFFSGCTINAVQHTGLDAPASPRDGGSLAVAEAAEGLNSNRVGWGRFTPFAIPVAPVFVHGDPPVDLMRVVEDALVAAGYNVTRMAEDAEINSMPMLEARFTRYSFNNYTWFAPIVPTWGGIGVTLTLREENGSLLWRQNFEGRGATLNFFDGYNSASNKSVTRMGQDMVTAFSRDRFYRAMLKANEAGEDQQ